MTDPEWSLATLLFADLRGFTTFAERATAQEAVAVLEAFFAAAVPAVNRHGGTVHRRLGDGFMAVFDGPRHADDAVGAAEAVLDAVAAPIGVGVNSGLVLAGEVDGVHDVIGDPVNVASRVQAATRDLGVPLLVTEATRCLMDGGDLEELSTVALRGRTRPVTLYGRPARRTSARCPS